MNYLTTDHPDRPIGAVVRAQLVDVLETTRWVTTIYLNLDNTVEMFIIFERPGFTPAEIGQVGTLTLVQGKGGNYWQWQASSAPEVPESAIRPPESVPSEPPLP